MKCRHEDGLSARWDHLLQDESAGTGWVVCRACGALLERITVAGGRFRGHGRFVLAFQEQIAREAPFSDLPELESD
jgi:hypothetical protein